MFWTNVVFQTVTDNKQRLFELLPMVPAGMLKLHWRVQKILGIFFTEIFQFLVYFRFFSKHFSSFWRKILNRFFKLHSTCPENVFEEKNVFEKIFWKKVCFLKFSRISIDWFWNIWQKSVDRGKWFAETRFYISREIFTSDALVFEEQVVSCFFSGFERTDFNFLRKILTGLSKRHKQAQRSNLRKRLFLKKFHFLAFWIFVKKYGRGCRNSI